jgi:hypothetical protein
MRYFFRRPEWELFPRDEVNHVMMICKCSWTMPLRLSSPYPVLMDPTRKIYHAERFHVFERDEVEMFHYSYVRRDIRSKLMNVSNRSNFFVDELDGPRQQLQHAISVANATKTPGAVSTARQAQMLYQSAYNSCVQTFAKNFAAWTPTQKIIHPHPHFLRQYDSVRTTDNVFSIEGGWLGDTTGNWD